VETPAERRHGREGFTLVEVLVAMVIFAVGLLALESMAIGAARAVARADRQSEYTAAATVQLEQVVQRVLLGQNPASSDASGYGVRTQTVVQRQAAGAGHWVYTIQVTVSPTTHQPFRINPITVVGRAMQPVN
jgi:prepilin-type N-terminal cleavage/methylation domain-containing protein